MKYRLVVAFALLALSSASMAKVDPLGHPYPKESSKIATADTYEVAYLTQRSFRDDGGDLGDPPPKGGNKGGN